MMANLYVVSFEDNDGNAEGAVFLAIANAHHVAMGLGAKAFVEDGGDLLGRSVRAVPLLESGGERVISLEAAGLRLVTEDDAGEDASEEGGEGAL